MTVEVLSPGMFSTVQDLGRPGFGHLGISAAGVCDPLAFRLGNRLLGNPENAPAIELTLLGGTYRFPQGATVVVAGPEFDCSIPLWTPTILPPGAAVKIGGARTGARCYLCVAGGIQVRLFAGSASTHVLTGLGGYQGRALKKGDILEIGVPHTAAPDLTRPAYPAPRKTLRVTPGPQAAEFHPSAIAAFYANPFTVTQDSNRMGLRLEGRPIQPPHEGEMISEGVSLGAIQIPSSGQPIILFVDQQTTGGYPKIANVITADLPSVGQLRPNDVVRFEPVDFTTARQIFFSEMCDTKKDPNAIS